MKTNSYIRALNEIGQSVWYDNLSKDVLVSGKLESYIEAGVSGLTSNPTIFKKAIADTSLYDGDISTIARRINSAESVCDELMRADVAQAADLLRDTYERTHGLDGFASIEVSPLLANDTAKTVDEAKRIWNLLSRPNIMIKIPATEAGIPAIAECLEAGINVNVTLIFSVEFYDRVIGAYQEAIRKRILKKGDVKKVASVASFFVSRVDVIVEKAISDLVARGALAKDKADVFTAQIGIANSKMAYDLFLKRFGQSFADARQHGAQVQRPLWASTGVKSPSLKEVYYVEALAGNQTVNTMPPSTLDALLRDAVINDALEGSGDAEKLLSDLAGCGIDLEGLLTQLQLEGVQSFEQSYRDLLAAVQNKMDGLNTK
ncbi:MAG: transaldolase [Bdellovibrionales bacterium]|nr:transaldolase [Bdellovibrionales bacterium]